MRSPSAARIRQGYLCQMDQNEVAREVIAQDWLPRYTGMPVDQFGDYVLLTNFRNYVDAFADRFDCEVKGTNRPMQAASNGEGLTIVNFGIGTANAATIMDLLTARMPEGVLFLGKCGGLKQSTEIGHFILPIAAIRGEGTSDDYFPPEVPALPSFKLHKFVSEKIVDRGLEYRTGVVYTTNRRLWEHDTAFKERLRQLTAIAIDMETATIFVVGHHNQISRGALLLVSDVPMTPDGIKTEESDSRVTADWAGIHLELGIDAMTDIGREGEQIRHFKF
jgi:AMP nucleosidase